jgi:hypothetical protein
MRAKILSENKLISCAAEQFAALMDTVLPLMPFGWQKLHSGTPTICGHSSISSCSLFERPMDAAINCSTTTPIGCSDFVNLHLSGAGSPQKLLASAACRGLRRRRTVSPKAMVGRILTGIAFLAMFL